MWAREVSKPPVWMVCKIYIYIYDAYRFRVCVPPNAARWCSKPVPVRGTAQSQPVVDGGSGFRVIVRKLSAPHVYRSRALLALNGQQRSTRSQSFFLEPFSLSFYIFRLRTTVGFLEKVCAAAYHYEKEDARALRRCWRCVGNDRLGAACGARIASAKSAQLHIIVVEMDRRHGWSC